MARRGRIMNKALAAVFAVGFLWFTLGQNYSIEDTTTPVSLEEDRLVWLPSIGTNCRQWTITQTEAAIEDVWSQAESMSINGEGTYGPEPVMIEMTGPGATFVFEYQDATGQAIYTTSIEVQPQDKCLPWEDR